MSPARGGPVRRPLVAGNWKMNLTHLEAIALVQKLAFTLREPELDAVEVVVLPPFTDLRSVQTVIEGDRLGLGFGAQDLSPHDDGAYTGDVSGVMLTALRCGYVVVGHSERRHHHHEGDDVVAAKVAAAHRHGLTPILCVGEPAEVRDAGRAVPHVLAQLDAALTGSAPDGPDGAGGPGGPAHGDGGVAGRLGRAGADLVLAYEPVWAIGTGRSAHPDDAQEMCAALRSRLGGLAGVDVARGTRILYGGSVKPGTAAETFRLPDVDGGLIGGASLVAEDFAAVCRAALP